MKKTISFYDFERAFVDYDRKENFSYGALRNLFDMFQEIEEGTGEEIELDVIAICCDYTELSLDDFIREYGLENDQLDSRETIQYYLEENATWWSFCHTDYPRDGEPHWTVVFAAF